MELRQGKSPSHLADCSDWKAPTTPTSTVPVQVYEQERIELISFGVGPNRQGTAPAEGQIGTVEDNWR
jgi:hypothetical protein